MASLASIVEELRGELGDRRHKPESFVSGPPRFELFHAANSICSQKVRVVLAHHHIAYRDTPMDIFSGQTYLPSYVRLRLLGCAKLPVPLASTHAGSTSVLACGCDAAVVPTLVDWDSSEVIVDSVRICLHLDRLMPHATRLRPARIEQQIDAEIAIVDNMPNYQMLMGQPPASSGSGANPRNGSTFAISKVQRCDRYIAQCAQDAALVEAYKAKRAKELQAAERLFSPEQMQSAYTSAEAALQHLNARLGLEGGCWLFGAEPTLADLFWTVELLRIHNLGAGVFWEAGRLPRIEAMFAAGSMLPSIRSAILDWPGAMY